MADFVIRPTMKFIKLGYTAVFVVIGLALALASNAPPSMNISPWYAAFAAVLLLWPAARQLRRRMTKITITGDKLRYESGFLSKSTRTIQLSKVQDVRVDQSLPQRMFGVGELSIETAGEASRLTVHNLDDPQAIADHIVEVSHAGSRGTTPNPPGSARSAP